MNYIFVHIMVINFKPLSSNPGDDFRGLAADNRFWRFASFFSTRRTFNALGLLTCLKVVGKLEVVSCLLLGRDRNLIVAVETRQANQLFRLASRGVGLAS